MKLWKFIKLSVFNIPNNYYLKHFTSGYYVKNSLEYCRRDFRYQPQRAEGDRLAEN
jgi:hypothetical protein